MQNNSPKQNRACEAKGRAQPSSLVPQKWVDKLHVVERYTRTSPDLISYEAIIDDPVVFNRPWKISMPLYRRQEKNAQLLDFKCVEFVEELLYGQYRKHPVNK